MMTCNSPTWFEKDRGNVPTLERTEGSMPRLSLSIIYKEEAHSCATALASCGCPLQLVLWTAFHARTIYFSLKVKLMLIFRKCIFLNPKILTPLLSYIVIQPISLFFIMILVIIVCSSIIAIIILRIYTLRKMTQPTYFSNHCSNNTLFSFNT
jgi:hypothetical protein